MRVVVALIMIGAIFAGCLDQAEPVKEQEDPEPANPVQPFARNASGRVPIAPDPMVFIGTIANDHLTGDVGHAGHQIAELHMGRHDIGLLDHHTLSTDLIGPSSGFIENHVVGDLMVVSSIFGSRGATLVDVSDPTNMQVLSHIYNLDDNWDARISDDGKYLFLGCQGSGAFDCTGIDDSGEVVPEVTGGGACTPVGVPSSCPGGIAVYNIEDPTSPGFEGYLHLGFTHNVYSYIREDKYYFMNAGIHIAEWDPTNQTLTSASTNVSGVHDAFVQQHPITGEWLLYTGGGGSMTIWNVDNPFNPMQIGNVDRTNTTIPPLWHEQTPLPCLINGRHITIGAGESGGGVPDAVGIVDTTDPRNPVGLGSWILPDHADITAQNMYRFSLHNIDANCDGQVAIAMYHAGVWVFDISTDERLLEPVTLAYYLPHERAISTGWSPITGAPIAGVISGDTPNTWSAQWSSDGTALFVPDMTTGVYSLGPEWAYEDAS